MGFEKVYGQKKAIRFLERALESNRIAHSYLFLGPYGVGKSTVAKLFATMLMARDCKGCQSCRTCRSILEEKHHDLIVVGPTKKEITIDQIRDLRQEVLNPPFESPIRFILIQDSHTMTLEAANAFLKTLEEPKPRNVFVLESSKESVLPPTIVSRCQKLRFEPIPVDQLAKFLMEEKGLAPQKAYTLAAIGNGSIKKALEWLETGTMEERTSFFYHHMGILKKGAGEASYAGYSLAQELLKKEEDPNRYLYLLLTWYRDMAATHVGVEPDLLLNQDFSTKLRSLSKGINLDAITEVALEIERARQEITKDINPNLVLGELFLYCKERLGGW